MTETAVGANVVQTAGSKRKRSHILGVISDLERRLPSIKGDTVAAAALADSVRRQILQKDSNQFNGDESAHRSAVLLWNLVIRLERDAEKTAVPTEYKNLLLHSRVLSFVVIDKRTSSDAAGSVGKEEPSVASLVLYALNVAVRAAKACIGSDGEDTELGHMVLERVTKYRQRLAKLLASCDDDNSKRLKPKADKLGISHLALQLTQLWRENRPVDADRLYTEEMSNLREDSFNTESLEFMAAALFRIGKSLLSKRDFASSVTWLDRARESLSKMDETTLSSGTKELRLSVTYSLAIACLGLQTPPGNMRARELTHGLRTVVTRDNDSRVQLIQLELHASSLSESFDATGYADILLQMIGAFKSSLDEFKLLHFHIQKLHSKSPGLGCKVLDEFMLSLRHRDDVMEWIEKLIITRVWLLAHQRETKEELDAVQSVLSKLRISIGADTASAAQTLIWKRIEQGYQERLFATAIQWCRLALCHIFEASGRANRTLIERLDLLDY
ncbi:uncharacterized protein SPSK_00255 [Sporothrix schenckii 1099-18]|uniref:Protein ZIP4 homolog n=1 Tax=Sporothrix schenckii 1099-18 TaxID=1397361 RepID=A0A0F2M2N1_SPOSC|nr:uncharacterized protein SPSK_00255 [Sporothrix schenckii 1099-18]KJR83953.1 hypothetical protein SPSK_00255 [Sporothrix schenckii 1099-18]